MLRVVDVYRIGHEHDKHGCRCQMMIGMSHVICYGSPSTVCEYQSGYSRCEKNAYDDHVSEAEVENFDHGRSMCGGGNRVHLLTPAGLHAGEAYVRDVDHDCDHDVEVERLVFQLGVSDRSSRNDSPSDSGCKFVLGQGMTDGQHVCDFHSWDSLSPLVIAP